MLPLPPPPAALVQKELEDRALEEPVVICGFGEVGQAVANTLESLERPMPYVAFDLTVGRVQVGSRVGWSVPFLLSS
jgi:voltage-gated potassium channel Kch